MDIVFMGTASAAGSKERDNTYLLLKLENRGWLIDVGGNPLGKLKQLAMPLGDIRGVIVTHLHTDHIYGLPSLLWGMWIAGRTEPLTIYCPEPGKRQLQAILEGYGVREWPIRFELDVRPFDWTEPTLLHEEEGLAFSVFPALHGVPAAGVMALCGDRVMVYSTDTRPNDWIRRRERIDLLVHEATSARGSRGNHTSLEELVRFYPLDRIGRVRAVHLTDDEPYREILAGIGKADVSLARDMLVETL